MCPPRGRRRASPHWHLLDATSPTSSRPGEHRPAQRQLTNPATRRRRRRPRASQGRGLTTGRCTLASASRRCRRRRDRDEQLQPRRRSKWRSEACESACRSLNSNNSEATAVQTREVGGTNRRRRRPRAAKSQGHVEVEETPPARTGGGAGAPGPYSPGNRISHTPAPPGPCRGYAVCAPRPLVPAGP